jgi:hypothetical protein
MLGLSIALVLLNENLVNIKQIVWGVKPHMGCKATKEEHQTGRSMHYIPT